MHYSLSYQCKMKQNTWKQSLHLKLFAFKKIQCVRLQLVCEQKNSSTKINCIPKKSLTLRQIYELLLTKERSKCILTIIGSRKVLQCTRYGVIASILSWVVNWDVAIEWCHFVNVVALVANNSDCDLNSVKMCVFLKCYAIAFYRQKSMCRIFSILDNCWILEIYSENLCMSFNHWNSVMCTDDKAISMH